MQTQEQGIMVEAWLQICERRLGMAPIEVYAHILDMVREMARVRDLLALPNGEGSRLKELLGSSGVLTDAFFEWTKSSLNDATVSKQHPLSSYLAILTGKATRDPQEEEEDAFERSSFSSSFESNSELVVANEKGAGRRSL